MSARTAVGRLVAKVRSRVLRPRTQAHPHDPSDVTNETVLGAEEDPRSDLPETEAGKIASIFADIIEDGDPAEDHTKNIGYVMDQSGRWRLSPAFDITFSFNPQGAWTSRHQMTLAGKADDWDRSEIVDALATSAGMSANDVSKEVDDIVAVASEWLSFSTSAGVTHDDARAIQRHFRLFP